MASCHVGRDALLLYCLCGFRRCRCLEDYLEKSIQLTIGEFVGVKGGVEVHSAILHRQHSAQPPSSLVKTAGGENRTRMT